MKARKDLLTQLENIAEGIDRLRYEMNHEAAVCEAELKERLELGLTGEAAIEHYNKWMTEAGLHDLVVDVSAKKG